MEFNKHVSLIRISFYYFILNLSCIVFGILFLALPFNKLFSVIFGISILLVLFGNFIIVHLTMKEVNNNVNQGKTIIKTCKVYLNFTKAGVIFMFIGNFLISNSYFPYNLTLRNIIQISIVMIGFFGIFLIGARISYLNFVFKDISSVWGKNRNLTNNHIKFINLTRKRKMNLLATIVFKTIGLIFGLLTVYVILVPNNGIFFWFGVIIAQIGIFLSIITICTIIAPYNYEKFGANRKFKYVNLVIGLLISGACLLPLIFSPLTIHEAETRFSEVYGSDWESSYIQTYESYLLSTRFQIPGYFLGSREPKCVIKEHISYLNLSNEGVTLYFDVYLPPNNGVGLPGRNSTLIRIHGGAWILGDKGIGNMMQMNKYFASQGYIVFDVQYGLYNGSYTLPIVTPEYVRGNFTIDDMVEHIGVFTKFIANNTYGANLSSVFVSGGSAGGQLCLATALGIHSGNYTGIFSDQLIIKGIVPFYPANLIIDSSSPLSNREYVSNSKTEFLDPAHLVAEESPPCLIFQGTQDPLLNTAKSFKETYDSYNNTCILLLFPFAGHANDLYFSGYYNQIFLYYMERFMLIHH